MVAVLQDNFSVAAISEEMVSWLEGWVVKQLTSELGIQLLQEKATSEPFAEVFSAIDATFDMRTGSTMVRPNKPVVDKLREMVAWDEGEMVRWEFDRVERLADLVSYIAYFLDSRMTRQARWKMIGQLASQPKVPEGIWFMR